MAKRKPEVSEPAAILAAWYEPHPGKAPSAHAYEGDRQIALCGYHTRGVGMHAPLGYQRCTACERVKSGLPLPDRS